jgi:peptidoglycan/LPS O-acetylase OafA/YrhL
VPALDGIRGIAIALVVVAHSAPTWYRPGGPAGVAVFFTLSGYLITRLLLTERDRTGRVDVPAFFVRRARRLLPALFAYLTIALIIGYWVQPFGTPAAAWPAVLYVANYKVIYGFGNLGGLLEAPVMGMRHLWSLSIEEQFYFLFPAALVWLRHRLPTRRLITALLALALASATLRLALVPAGADYVRIYMGTDTTACLLLIGCALAVWRHEGHRLRASAVTPALAAMVPLTLVTGPWSLASMTAVVPLAASLLTALAIASADQAPRWLRWRPLTMLGQRSYALYLWHPPMLFMWRAFGGGPLLWLVFLAAAWGVTLLSWRYVEEPLLRVRDRPVANSTVLLRRQPN